MSVVSLRATPRWRALARAAASRPPCFHDATLHRLIPSVVRGPVLVPPCIRQRPFGIAGPRQARPVRLQRALQRAASLAATKALHHAMSA